MRGRQRNAARIRAAPLDQERLLLNGSGGHPHPEREAPIQSPDADGAGAASAFTELANDIGGSSWPTLRRNFPGMPRRHGRRAGDHVRHQYDAGPGAAIRSGAHPGGSCRAGSLSCHGNWSGRINMTPDNDTGPMGVLPCCIPAHARLLSSYGHKNHPDGRLGRASDLCQRDR